MVLLEVSLMDLHSSDIQGDKIDIECGVTPSIVDELYSWDIEGDQMEGKNGVIRGIIDDLHF